MAAKNQRNLLARGQSEAAYTLLEVLSTLTLTAVLFSLCLPALSIIKSAVKETRIQESYRARFASLSAVFETGFSLSTTYYAFPGVYIHPPGDTSFLGSSSLSRSLQPADTNAAVSFIILTPELSLRKAAPEGHPQMPLYCQRDLPPLTRSSSNRIQDISHWAGVGVDGFIALKGQLTKSPSNKCQCLNGIAYKANLHSLSTKHFLHNHLGSIPSSSTVPPMLLGIKDAYTLYLDNSGTLRRKSLITNENQPVIRNISSLLVTKETMPSEVERFVVEIALTNRIGQEKIYKNFYYFRLKPAGRTHLDLVF